MGRHSKILGLNSSLSDSLRMTEEEESDLMYFFLYFFGTCFGLFFLIFLLFLCFSGRICVFIYCKVTRTSNQNGPNENAPLIVESDYFPRPGYDGYCLVGQDPPQGLVLHSEIVLSHSIDIGQGSSQVAGADTPESGNFPKGILTPKATRMIRGIKGKSRPGDSLKSVSFNPRTEFQLV